MWSKWRKKETQVFVKCWILTDGNKSTLFTRHLLLLRRHATWIRERMCYFLTLPEQCRFRVASMNYGMLEWTIRKRHRKKRSFLHKLILGSQKQTSQKKYRTLIFSTMLGHMQNNQLLLQLLGTYVQKCTQ